MSALTETINHHCVCWCTAGTEIDDFLEYCVQRDAAMICSEMLEIKNEWKQNRKKERDKIQVKIKNKGLKFCISIFCPKFKSFTPASGMDASDVLSLFSFIGLPNLQSFSKRQFNRIQLLIGKYLRDTAKRSMERGLNLEVHSTQ